MITLQQVSRSYRTAAGTFIALQDIDLEIASGEFVAIVGKSGSGKSTLLNLIGGIDTPSAGSLTVAGTRLVALKENQLAAWRGRTVGFVFQFFQLLPTLTAVENVMLPMDFSGKVPASQRRRRALDLLDRAGVVRHAGKLPAGLSGGEQQRVAIARALANEPPIILADEPTGNLDSHTAGAVLGIFQQLAHSGTTVVIVTHDRDIAQRIDRTIELADGTLIRDEAAA